MDSDEVDPSFRQVRFFCINIHESVLLILFACLTASQLLSSLWSTSLGCSSAQRSGSKLLGSRENKTNDIFPGSSRTAWMSSTLWQSFRSTSRSSSLVAPDSRLHYIFCPRLARHEDHQQGRHHDPSGQQNVFSLNSISGQSNEDPPHFQDGSSFRWAAKHPLHIARGLEGAGDHHACGHHHHAHLLQPSLCFWTKRPNCRVLVSLLLILYLWPKADSRHCADSRCSLALYRVFFLTGAPLKS